MIRKLKGWVPARPVLGLMVFCVAAIGLLALPGTPARAGVGTGADFNNPRGIAIEASGNFVVADFGNGNIIRIDADTGNRTLLSDNSDTTQGIQLIAPAGIAVTPDGRIFISDTNLQAVVEIERETGLRTILAGGASTGDFITPFGITTGRIKGRTKLIVSDTGSLVGGDVVGPVIVDPETSEVTRIPVPEDNIVQFNDPRFAATHSRNGKIYVGNFGSGSIVEVNPYSGERRVISQNPSVGTGAPFGTIIGLTLSQDNRQIFVIDNSQEAVVRVDLETGNRTVVSQTFAGLVGAGADFVNPAGIVRIDTSSGPAFMVTDFGIPGLVAVDANGDRVVFSSSDINGFGGPRDMLVLGDGRVVVADFATERVIAVDPVTGDRTLLSGPGKGEGTGFNGPVAVSSLDAGRIAVAEFNQNAVFAVDLATGNRTPITGLGVGGGSTVSARGMIQDPSNPGQLLTSSFTLDAVQAVDVATGNRSIVSAAGTRGAGPALNNPLGIAVDTDGAILVADIGNDSVFAVDPGTGDRTVVTDGATGTGPALLNPFGVSVIDGEILVADSGLRAIVKVDRATGNRTIVSGLGQGVGAGPDLANVFSIRSLNANTLIVSDFSLNAVIAVNRSTGDRSILSDASNGSDN